MSDWNLNFFTKLCFAFVPILQSHHETMVQTLCHVRCDWLSEWNSLNFLTYIQHIWHIFNAISRPKRRQFVRLNFCSYRIVIVNFWNSLPESVVSAPSIYCFKHRSDKHCIDLVFFHFVKRRLKISQEAYAIRMTDDDDIQLNTTGHYRRRCWYL